jgi:hypothetical protein
MNLREMFIGALTLRTETFVQLRERSDTFFRGFWVLFVAGVIAAVFGATQTLALKLVPPPPKEVIINSVQLALGNNPWIPSGMQSTVQSYAVNSASLAYELSQLPPQVGASAIPLANALDWLGTVISTPFDLSYIGWTLLGGLIIGGVAASLGGKNDLNKMLGLTALAAAPQAFNAIPAFLATLATLTGITALTSLNGLMALAFALWSAVIYVKATAVAQQFTIGRAIGSIALGVGALALMVVLLTCIIAWAFGQFV